MVGRLTGCNKMNPMSIGLCKRGFFGHVLRDAAKPSCVFVCKKRGQRRYKNLLNSIIRLIYFINVGGLLTWLSVLVVRQDHGDYRCRSFSVHFGDDTWDEAWVELEGGVIEKRLLVYSHFNGIYVGEVDLQLLTALLTYLTFKPKTT